MTNERTRREMEISKVMALFRIHVSVMLPTLLLLFFSSSSFGVCHAAHGAGLISLKRSLAETPSFANIIVDSNSFVLAASRTHRQDPFDDFKYYAGGWNISNVHYWTSVSFTAAPLFIIAVIWFLGFGLVLFLISCYYCCCSRRKYSYSRPAYAFSLIFLILFTCAAIIGCIVLYNGQGKFHGSTSSTMDYVVGQADFVVDNLRNFSGILSEAKNISVDQIFIPSDIGRNIDVVCAKLNSSASELETRVADNSERIKDKLDTVRLVLIVVAAVMLLLTLLGFYFSVLGQQFLVHILVVIGWILVTATFVLCGVFLIFHNVVADSCVAMQEWVVRPQAHTALDDILPCVDPITANDSLYQSKEVTYQLSNVINQVILNITNKNFPPNAGPLYYNQSGPLVPVLCNPYTEDLNNATCNTGEVVFSNASQVWKNFVCSTAIVSGSEICTSIGRITPKVYNQMISAVSVCGGLELYGPFLVQLGDCTFVRDTFGTIDENNCPGLNRYSKWIYIGLAMASSAVMLSLIFWVVYAKERRHRANNKQFIALSVPSSLAEKTP